MQSMPKRPSLRAAVRAADEALIEIAAGENWKIDSRIRALAELSGLINGYILQLQAQRPAPPKGPPKFEPVYL